MYLHRIIEAIDYYSSCGYSIIEDIPLWVDYNTSDITRPPEAKQYTIKL